jgi:hypothetical protein
MQFTLHGAGQLSGRLTNKQSSLHWPLFLYIANSLVLALILAATGAVDQCAVEKLAYTLQIAT